MAKTLTTARLPAAVLFILLFSVLASGCSGLSGEPKVVTTLRPAVTTAPVIDPSDSLALGGQIFAARCTSCHGIGGRGDGDLVRAGQIANVPDFTDPERRAGLTVEDYFEVITNGRIEKMMPPWKDALSEAERRAVAEYAYHLADDIQVAAGQTPVPDSTLTPDGTTAASPEPETQITGVVEGAILNGTAGAAAPDALNILLFVINPAGEEVFSEIATAAESSFRFEDVPVEVNNAYFASAVYNDVTFVAALNLTVDKMPSEPVLDLPLTVYEVTSDPSVIEIDLLLNQAVIRSESLLDNLIVVRFHNTSDRAYRQDEALADGRYASVGINLPQGASPAGISASRYFWDEANRRVLDTLAVIPEMEHIVQIGYTVPLDDRILYEYTVDHAVTNQPELMLRPGEFLVDSQQFQSQGVGQFTGGEFEDFLAQPLDAGATVKFELIPLQGQADDTSAPANLSTLGIGLTISGVVLLSAAGGWYLLQRRREVSAESLIAQIAELDLQYQAGQIDGQGYQRLRDLLKQKLTDQLQRNPPR